jgi:hypothetical protein
VALFQNSDLDLELMALQVSGPGGRTADYTVAGPRQQSISSLQVSSRLFFLFTISVSNQNLHSIS